MKDVKKEIEIKEYIGGVTPYWSADTFRMVLPKWMAREYSQVKRNESFNEENKKIAQKQICFFKTNSGILLTSLADAVNDDDLRGLIGGNVRGSKSMIKKMITDNIDEINQKLDQ